MLIDLPTAARYNQWANRRIYDVASELTNDALWEDRRGFFKSIAATMNHILLVDLLYRERLEKKPTTFTRLDEILYGDFNKLRTAHLAQDQSYVDFCDSSAAPELEEVFSFESVGIDEPFSGPWRVCLTNQFQHQTHHRGQVHHMISHARRYPPPLDFIQFVSTQQQANA